MHPYFLGTTRKRFFLTCHPAQIAIRYEGWHVNPGDTLHCFFMVAFYLPISQAHVYLRSCLNRRINTQTDTGSSPLYEYFTSLLLPLLDILSNRYNKHNMYLPTQSSAKDLLWFNDFVRRTVPGIIFFKWWCCEELLEKPKKSLRFVYMDKILYYSYDIMDARSRTVGMYI